MLEMNIQQQEYLDTTSGAGVRVDISDQGQMPFPLESGVSLAPGFSTMIGLKKVHTLKGESRYRRNPFIVNYYFFQTSFTDYL